MKLLSLIITLFLATPAFASLQTLQYVVGRQFQLIEFQMHDEHQVRGQVTSGKLVVSEGLVEMILHVKKVCPPDRLCTMEMPAPFFVKLPVVQIEKSDCGDRIVAEMENADGSLEQLVLLDYTTATCQLNIENPLHVEYNTGTATENLSATSEFQFAPLKQNFPLSY